MINKTLQFSVGPPLKRGSGYSETWFHSQIFSLSHKA